MGVTDIMSMVLSVDTSHPSYPTHMCPFNPTYVFQALSVTLAAPLCPTIRHAYSTLLRVAQMEVQLFDSLFRVPDTDSPNAPTAAAGVSINGGVGVGVGEGSSVPVKKPVVSVEVVSIIESVCNATGQ